MKQKKSETKNKKLSDNTHPANPIDIDAELKKAFQYHQAEQLQAAETIYKMIVAIHPNHADSLYRLGLIACQRKNYNTGIRFFKKVIRIHPDFSDAHYNMGGALMFQDKLEEAIASWRKTVEIKPDFVEAHYYMGKALHSLNRITEAAACFHKVIRLNPNFAKAFCHMGIILRNQGKSHEAIEYLQKAVQIAPGYAAAYYHMGNALTNLKKTEESIVCYRKAVKINPRYAEAYYNMGVSLSFLSKTQEALASFQKALAIKPDYADAFNSIGILMNLYGKTERAVACFHKTLEIQPNHADAHLNMGNIMNFQGRINDALTCYHRAIEIRPDFAEAHNNMGAALSSQGRLEDAITCYRKALALDPEHMSACGNLVSLLKQTCQWEELENMESRLDEFTARTLANGERAAETPFVCLMRTQDLSRNFAVARSWSLDISKRIPFTFDHRNKSRAATSISHLSLPTSHFLRVGYLSNDFRDHPVAHLMVDGFGLHDRNKFKIFCYSYSKDDDSYYRRKIRSDCDKFVDLHPLSCADAAKSIYEDQIDILIDLTGYTTDNRIDICAFRPAPIQVSYIGFLGTTGADFFDYIIADKIVAPEDHTPYYSEKFVYMPDGYQINSYARKDQLSAINNQNSYARSDLGLPENGFVFCSFNAPYKIDRIMFDCWMEILLNIPESVLWLARKTDIGKKNLQQAAASRGVNPERLVFAEKLPLIFHLERLTLADLALDTRIYNGGATTSNALWQGVPVITLQGGHFVSRMSSSLLTFIGLPELIAHNLDEYKDMAIHLATHPEALQTIRQKLEKNRLSTPLFDTPRFIRNLENAYTEMQHIFLSGEKPRQIKVC